MAPLLQEIATETGLRCYNEPGPFKSTKGLVIGIRDNFIVSIGIAGTGLNQVVGAAIRFKRAADEKALLASMSNIPELKTFTGGGGFKLVGKTLVWTFSKPVVGNANKIVQQLDAILRMLALHSESFKMGKCEADDCNNDVSQVTLINGNCNLICDSCSSRVAGELEKKRLAYESLPVNFVKGLSYAFAGAIASSLAAGLVLYWTTSADGKYNVKLFVVIQFLVVVATAYMAKLGIGRITTMSTFVTIVPALTGLLISNVLFFTLLYAGVLREPVSLNLAGRVLFKLWLLKSQDFYGKLIAFLEVVAACGSPTVLWEMRPKFSAAYKNIGTPSITHSNMVRIAGA